MGSGIRFLICWALVVLALSLSAVAVQAQTAAEFLRQKKTQEKYLLKQLAYMQLYGSEIRKGYELARDGWNTISGFTSGEFKLHEAFFDALAVVSPVVKMDFRVLEIAQLQISIRSSFGSLAETLALTPATKDYISEVRKKVIDDCDADLEELLDIVLSGKVEMNDEERLARLKAVHEAMLDKAHFTAHFCTEITGQVLNQKRYLNDIERIRRLYEKH
jgi:nucleotidyltransferase/DNA polymerase involved in DNA repair